MIKRFRAVVAAVIVVMVGVVMMGTGCAVLINITPSQVAALLGIFGQGMKDGSAEDAARALADSALVYWHGGIVMDVVEFMDEWDAQFRLGFEFTQFDFTNVQVTQSLVTPMASADVMIREPGSIAHGPVQVQLIRQGEQWKIVTLDFRGISGEWIDDGSKSFEASVESVGSADSIESVKSVRSASAVYRNAFWAKLAGIELCR